MNDIDRDVTAIADELLAIRCQLGEPEAFTELVERWHEPIRRYVRRVADNDEMAGDIVQDIWLRVLRGMPRLRDPARLRAWLFGIARRSVMDRLRQRYTEPEPASLDDVDVAIGDAVDDDVEQLALLREELTRLPFVEREVLVLFYLRELTLAQLADILAVPVGTVKSRLFRARRLLRQQLVDRGIER
jgi:RNA polymerase sigma-70 factor (ECF subfamily)